MYKFLISIFFGAFHTFIERQPDVNTQIEDLLAPLYNSRACGYIVLDWRNFMNENL